MKSSPPLFRTTQGQSRRRIPQGTAATCFIQCALKRAPQRANDKRDSPTPRVVLCITLASSLTLTYHSEIGDNTAQRRLTQIVRG